MPIVFDDTQEMLRDSALAFLKDNAPISALRTLRDTHDPVGFSRDLWRQATELGFTGVLIDRAGWSALSWGCMLGPVLSGGGMVWLMYLQRSPLSTERRVGVRTAPATTS